MLCQLSYRDLLVHVAGFEPATSPLSGVRSDQTELNAIINSGSVNLLRTLRPTKNEKVPELFTKALPPTLFKGSVFFLSGNFVTRHLSNTMLLTISF